MEVNIHEAKTHLSRLLEKVLTGEEVIIAKHGKPIAKITALDKPKKRRIPGRNVNKGSIHDDFNDPLPEDILKGFLG
jgi:prevent-host-death family protein